MRKGEYHAPDRFATVPWMEQGDSGLLNALSGTHATHHGVLTPRNLLLNNRDRMIVRASFGGIRTLTNQNQSGRHCAGWFPTTLESSLCITVTDRLLFHFTPPLD